MARIEDKYKTEIVPVLMERFGHKNRLAVPRISKITLNMGVGRAIENQKRLDAAVRDLTVISGQKPAITKAKKSIAGFKLRQGVSIGCKVTLRGKRMYEFFDRLISVAIPRIRDFRGFSNKAFDGQGNYTLGLSEQLVFPEVNIDSVEFTQGLDVTLTIDRSNPEQSRAMMELFGFPFRR